MINLDQNATTSLDPKVKEVLISLLDESLGNPSSIHFLGREAKKRLTQASRECADLLGVSLNELFFTSGATESLNTLIFGLTSHKKNPRIITCALEHQAVLSPLQKLEKKGAEVVYLTPKDSKGAPSLHEVEESLTLGADLLIFMAANNETGICSPIEEIAELAAFHRIPLIVDGVAVIGKMPFKLHRGMTGVTFSSHKMHGPLGVGITILRKNCLFEPLIYGGMQQSGRRAGTENFPAILGATKALRCAIEELPNNLSHLRALQTHFESKLRENIPSILIHGEKEERVANTSNIAFPGIDGEMLLMRLDQAGVFASFGSACSAGALEPSKVLIAMNLDKAIVNSSIRFSYSKMTTLEEIDRAVEIIVALVQGSTIAIG